ncbi:MAG: cytochrome C [Alphaproteobacteria bacterium]|nr:cytochrome C [Alphaproteobacteria bacterium]
MSRRPDDLRRLVRIAAVAVLGSALAVAAYASDKFPGIGRPATPAEIAAWDIDVRPDFSGLPRGSGSVERGLEIWEGRCASCHGTFGESNQVFTPLIGGTTKDDIASGTVANLKRQDYPQRTMMMKVPYVATLFDYVRRAMPWNEPKTLEVDEVYAVLAYMLNLAEIVPDGFVLDERTIRDVQGKMPNRHGMTTDHAMWFGSGFGKQRPKPDTANVRCMQNCADEVTIASRLPDYAWPAHGNLASQSRRIGPVRGRVTGDDDPDAVDDPSPPALKLAQAAGCMGCHGISNKIVGPSYADVAARYRGKDDVAGTLVTRVLKGAEGVWGPVAMPPQEDLSEENAQTIVEWILAGARQR